MYIIIIFPSKQEQSEIPPEQLKKSESYYIQVKNIS